ncbi:unnamed protein product [Mycena citricolor]|uniref:Protein LCHN n=1 Tax=Mycena citricolor TaxID=2018698 RepID=A0AAD2Q2S4_9AGAR|nr:unnamed protein product [Mycena citricolor]
MCASHSKGRYPQDIVAIFHASFHPTKGNIIDWALKANDDLSLKNLEFNALPSGLHLVEQDVVYFNKDDQHGVCVFKRRKTVDHGHRGFRLSSLGILVGKSSRPRPWRHTVALKELINNLYSRFESLERDPTEADWEPARIFFEARKASRPNLGGAGDWNGWSEELLERLDDDALEQNPTLHLPHLLRILGPSSLTLYKHVVARRRVMIYTVPPVEAASILCQVAADMCYELQVEETSSEASSSSTPSSSKPHRRGKHQSGTESERGNGWVACTTDALFLEKPHCYDLIIDLTTAAPGHTARPTFYASRPISSPSKSARPKGPSHRLSIVRFSWSDVKLWNEVNRILKLDHSSSHSASCCTLSVPESKAKPGPITVWTDAWRVYEDVCVICAGLLMGMGIGAWAGRSAAGSDGHVHLEGEDEVSLHGLRAGGKVRNLGLGIEGGPKPSMSSFRTARRSSAVSWSSGRATINATGTSSFSKGKGIAAPEAAVDDEEEDEDDSTRTEREKQILTTLSLLQTLHAQTSFQLAALDTLLPRSAPTVVLTSREMPSLGLSPVSSSDARFLEWLAKEYGGDVEVIVKRGWKDAIAAVLGY